MADFGFVLKNDKSPQKLELVLSKTLKAQIQIGSNKSIDTDLTPDYLLCVDSKAHCILDAKAPKIDISKGSKAQKQALSYMLAFECELYALCNGRKFIAFNAQGVVVEVDLTNERESKMPELKELLTKQKAQKSSKIPSKKNDEWYLSREIPKPILNPKKQEARRHFGCLAYFTRQSWDIVTQNIKAFTSEGDIVLDSFGGTGVTAIEAMMNNRYGIHTDLNPLSIFMVKALSAKVNLGDLYDLSEEILSEFETLRPKNDKEAKALLKNAKYYPNAIDKEFGEVASTKMQDSTLWIPKDEMLPKKGSDVDSVLKLFTKMQLAELAILRKLILQKTIKQKEMRYSLLLAFYNTLSLINLTFHPTPDGGGNYFAFYKRYRVAKKPIFLNTNSVFRQKIKRVLMGKRELENSPHFYNAYFESLQRVIKDFKSTMLSQRENLEKVDSLESKTNGEKIFQADATNLAEIESQSVDFIYTDPPYGAKIPYLDLSVLWNAWLDLPVDLATREKECIEKGSLEKSKYDYEDLMKKSLKEMYRVLKFNRWLAFVFQHQDTRLFQVIVESAENVGFEYVGCISQDNGQTTFVKRQFPTRVLKGQLILYFKKIDNAKSRAKTETGTESLEQMFKDIEKVIVENDGASLELINANLVKMALEGGYHTLMSKFENVLLLINERFDYDSETKLYHIRDSAKIFNYGIPIEERARYYILGELKKADRENSGVKFDSLCLNILPLLKNGIQANKKLVREILSELAIENKETGEWKLKTKEPKLFDD
ncbi:DNA methyltransferase [Helicobacter sp. 23-1048]